MAAPWHGRDPLDVQNAITAPTASPRRGGLLLLFAAAGLLVLVLASGSTLRKLMRLDRGLKA